MHENEGVVKHWPLFLILRRRDQPSSVDPDSASAVSIRRLIDNYVTRDIVATFVIDNLGWWGLR